jgi:hypothetical protein
VNAIGIAAELGDTAIDCRVCAEERPTARKNIAIRVPPTTNADEILDPLK